MRRHIAVTVTLLCFAVSTGAAANDDAFEIRSGTNISHWLSQSGRRGEARRQWFTEKDVKLIASLGFDHIRLPIDAGQMWDEAGHKEVEAFELLHNAIGWARDNKLRVIVDLHILRSHHFNEDEKPLWTEPAAQEKFFQLWRELSAELRRYSVALVAYELMNEPVADDPDDWNRLVAKAVAVIRVNEPHRKIVIGSNRWQSTSTFDQLRIPAGDRDIILSFHFYTPMLITHYKASWTSVGKYKGPVNYPGLLVKEEDIEGLPEDVARIVRNNNGTYDGAKLEALLAKPLALAQKLDLPLYCGEWGALPTVARDARMQWYRDMRSNLEKHGIAWANWDYKGGFGIVTRNGQPDREFIEVLLGR
ncbi:MAG: cellulase family glycosylhydrolase [Phycisphaerales bacterium]|nr:MAG: cellulase family glycosylhydrolase [Phycisphaerales bacterium]